MPFIAAGSSGAERTVDGCNQLRSQEARGLKRPGDGGARVRDDLREVRGIATRGGAAAGWANSEAGFWPRAAARVS